MPYTITLSVCGCLDTRQKNQVAYTERLGESMIATVRYRPPWLFF